jgi:hypothetical protein
MADNLAGVVKRHLSKLVEIPLAIHARSLKQKTPKVRSQDKKSLMLGSLQEFLNSRFVWRSSCGQSSWDSNVYGKLCIKEDVGLEQSNQEYYSSITHHGSIGT